MATFDHSSKTAGAGTEGKKKGKVAVDEKQRTLVKLKMQSQLTWDEEGESSLKNGGLKIVILKHSFTLDELKGEEYIYC